MAKSLGGSLFIKDGEKYDYCYKEAIRCLKEFCDKVAIVEVGSNDGTEKAVHDFADHRTTVINLPISLWDATDFYGKEKLTYFSNIAHSLLDTDYFFNLQGDEIVHENSYDAIRYAIETGHEGFLCTRVNLWGDCFHQLNVPQERKPCSSEVIRIAKKGYGSYDDAESLRVQCSVDFVHDIKMVHYGFVRKKEIMPKKVRNMLGNIFRIGLDPKLDGMEVWDGTKWFTEEDLIPFNDHPAIMSEWIKTRP